MAASASTAPAACAVGTDPGKTNESVLPNLTTTQRNAIPNKVKGMVIYNVTTDTHQVWNGAAWLDGTAGGLTPDGATPMAADFDMDGNKVINLLAGVAGGDAVNKTQLDAAAATAAAATAAATPHNTIADPGDAAAIPVTLSGLCALTSGAVGETRTLPIPTKDNQQITLCMNVDGGGDIAVTVASDVTQTPGENVLTFSDAGEFITLQSIKIAGVRAWRILANDGVVLS